MDFECRILCSVFIVFARGDDKTSLVLSLKTRETEFQWEKRTQIRIRASSTRQVFFNETKVPVENMLSEEEMVSKSQ
jgi:alkylation response protein AidB-like acyl-CoA dehydrogenase